MFGILVGATDGRECYIDEEKWQRGA